MVDISHFVYTYYVYYAAAIIGKYIISYYICTLYDHKLVKYNIEFFLTRRTQ